MSYRGISLYVSGLSVYNVMVLCLIGVPVAWMLKEQMDAAHALISLFIFFATLSLYVSGLSVYNVMVLCLIGVPVAWML